MNKDFLPSKHLVLSSVDNPKVKLAKDLRERKTRDQEGLFLIEGYREVLRAQDSHVSITQLFVCKELFLGTNEQTLIDRVENQGANIIECSQKVFEKMSYRDRPDGLIAVARQMKHTLKDLEKTLKKDPLLILAESIEKPGNLGTILRSADAAGADAVIVLDRCTDIYNPNVVRASVGTLFTIPVIEETTDNCLEWLKKYHITIVAATPHAEKNYTDVSMQGPLAIAFGTEQLGLSKKLLQAATLGVKIPMKGVADSLNVAMATTLLLYEALRQRTHAS